MSEANNQNFGFSITESKEYKDAQEAETKRIRDLLHGQHCNRHAGHTFPCQLCDIESQTRQIENDQQIPAL